MTKPPTETAEQPTRQFDDVLKRMLETPEVPTSKPQPEKKYRPLEPVR
jgi:hypothetical protein